MTLKKPENTPDFDVLEFMRSLSPVHNEKYECATVADWTACWLLHYCNELKDSTKLEYQKTIHQHINRVLGKVMLNELSHEDVQLFINSLNMGVGIENKLSPKSIKNIHGVLHSCLKTAVDFGYINANPADKIRLPKKAIPEVRHLEPDILHKFLAAIQNHPKKALFTVSIFTGMREGEILALTWDCIRFDIGEIYLYRQLSNKNTENEYRFTSLKNGKTRTLRPAPFIIKLLKEQYDAANPDLSDFVFKNAKGEHYTHSALYNAFQRVMKRLRYQQHLRFHDLRHTYAVLSLLAGDDIKTLQMNLGHYSAAFTLDVYGHRNDLMMKQSADKMERLIHEQFPELLEPDDTESASM
ncbi:MAG: site-specific integrase [Oscillospiraceae bacterium]|nr:site-specific integrase [Oscillospiraceae bacterium]